VILCRVWFGSARNAGQGLLLIRIMRATRYIGGLSRRIRFSTTPANVLNPSMTSDSNLKSLLTPIACYEELVRHGDITEDSHQRHAVEQLQKLYDQIILFDSTLSTSVSAGNAASTGKSSWFSSLFTANQNSLKPANNVSSSIKGLYMYGGTGCGKTFIMDLFFEVIPIKRKKRVHFNNFMIDIHKRLHRLKSATKGSSKAVGDNIMEQITNELMEEAYLLCFDEFQVTDIADAMILKSLFESMLSKGAIVVATSNRPPLDLYKNGLQRVLFLPFIKTLNDSTNVLSLMESSMDYRLVKSADRALVSSEICPKPLNTYHSSRERACMCT
jgi:peroxisome-assembly ATPase